MPQKRYLPEEIIARVTFRLLQLGCYRLREALTV
jgi:hypothetical protein